MDSIVHEMKDHVRQWWMERHTEIERIDRILYDELHVIIHDHLALPPLDVYVLVGQRKGCIITF